MLTILTLTLAALPMDLDVELGRRDQRVLAPAETVSPGPQARPESESWPVAPLLTVEGRSAHLLTDAEVARVKELDERLANRNPGPGVVMGLGALAAVVPVGYCIGMGVMLVVESIKLTALLAIFSPFTFALGFVAGIVQLPLVLGVVGAVGLGVFALGGLWAALDRAERLSLSAERQAILQKAGRDVNASLPALAPLSTVATF